MTFKEVIKKEQIKDEYPIASYEYKYCKYFGCTTQIGNDCPDFCPEHNNENKISI